MKRIRIDLDLIIVFWLAWILFSCKKEQPDPIPEVEVIINGQVSDMVHGQIRKEQDDFIFRADSDGAESYLRFNFGSNILTSYEITAAPFPQYLDTVELSINGPKYYVKDTAGPFYMNVSDSAGYYSGDFVGEAHNDFFGVVTINGGFKHLKP